VEEKKPAFAAVGAIIGAILLFLVIRAAVDYFQAGQLRLEAAEAIVAEVAPGAELANVVAETESTLETAATTPITDTATITGTESITDTGSITNTAPLTGTAPITGTDSVTRTGSITETTAPPAIETLQASEAVVAVVNKGTCNACHVIPGVPGAVGMVGPDLTNIGTVAAERKPGVSAADYLLESIMDPNAFIAPECPFGSCVPGAMPATLATSLTTEEIATIIDYLLTLHGVE
jgi:hypothetical protein